MHPAGAGAALVAASAPAGTPLQVPTIAPCACCELSRECAEHQGVYLCAPCLALQLTQARGDALLLARGFDRIVPVPLEVLRRALSYKVPATAASSSTPAPTPTPQGCASAPLLSPGSSAP